ncbi:hypothetical protein RRG08_054723 [Elysia crispata]|uniref:Uncharacterized protein n=1 Tax=Elysia crispata TaxID=231223 RepID=A0AAE1B2J3_9GAST|nr:hypothetical protein RRG08_054723 [Elysia crispata]
MHGTSLIDCVILFYAPPISHGVGLALHAAGALNALSMLVCWSGLGSGESRRRIANRVCGDRRGLGNLVRRE